MNKIPTAEEYLKNFIDFKLVQLKEYTPKMLTNDIKIAMIEFTKLHVEAALEEASEKAVPVTNGAGEWAYLYVDKDSILQSYPLRNIK